MSKYNEETSRLVVMFRRDGDNEQFQWGMVGAMPLMSLIGCIVRIQTDLGNVFHETCDQMALVLAWNADQREFSWFLHPDLPIQSLVGMLEVIKATLVGSQLARQAAAQQVGLVDRNGKPLRR